MKRFLGLVPAAVGIFIAGCGQRTGPAGPALKNVPRSRTLVMDCTEGGGASQFRTFDCFNPFLPSTPRTGVNFLYEPLYYYAAHRATNNLIPWIAREHAYNADFTEVTVKIRPDVAWSDGTPWTAADVVFTANMLKEHAPRLLFSTDIKTWVRDVEAPDPCTVRFHLTAPNPQFLFSYFAYNFDNGIQIVPKHVWEGKDPETFTNLDYARGWPVVSGPYRMVYGAPQQIVLDRRDDWWATRAGVRMPKVERLVYLAVSEEAKMVQNLLANETDTSLDLRPVSIKTVLDRNPSVTTWSGRQPPYGYLDWWPICLGFNAIEAPFDDPEIRWAISHAIDRRQLVDVGWKQCGDPTLLPFPDFPPMRIYTEAVAELLRRHPVGAFDPKRTAEIMRRKGWELDGEKLWVKDGQRLKMVVEIFVIFQDLAPILAAQLRAAGFDASFRMTADSQARIMQGNARTYLFGNGGSVRDPYFTLRLYHSRHVQPTGTETYPFWRWKNEEFDRRVDAMGKTPTDDPKFMLLYREAMDTWLRELPSIPLVQWYHRIPHNQTYWRNWPCAENPTMNTAYWHRTWLQVLLQLEPVR